MTFTSTNWVHTTNDHNFFFSRNWMPSNNDLYFNKLIGFIYTTNDHNFFVSRNWMPSKLIMTFKRTSWTQSINLDIGLQFFLTTKCHQEPKKIVCKTSCRQLHAKIENVDNWAVSHNWLVVDNLQFSHLVVYNSYCRWCFPVLNGI